MESAIKISVHNSYKKVFLPQISLFHSQWVSVTAIFWRKNINNRSAETNVFVLQPNVGCQRQILLSKPTNVFCCDNIMNRQIVRTSGAPCAIIEALKVLRHVCSKSPKCSTIIKTYKKNFGVMIVYAILLLNKISWSWPARQMVCP